MIGSSIDRDYDTISMWTLKLIVTSVTPPNTQGDKILHIMQTGV